MNNNKNIKNIFYPYKVKNLPYSMVSLEPVIDKTTLLIHHDKIYVKYVEKFNYLLMKEPNLQNYTIEELLFNPYLIPANIYRDVLYNAGGIYNHELYFDNLSSRKQEINGCFKDEVCKHFECVNNFYDEIIKLALSPINYHWIICGMTKDKRLVLLGLKDNDTTIPLDIYPLLVIDIAEHAYFIKYHNHKDHYVKSVLEIINYDIVNERLELLNK